MLILISLAMLTISVIMGGIVTGILYPTEPVPIHKCCWIVSSIIIMVLLFIMLFRIG